MKCPHCNKDTDEFYVRITKAELPTFWYVNHIGDVFRVTDFSREDYRHAEGSKYISKCDAEAVRVTKE